MIELKPVEIKRDRCGMWFHPSLPWNDMPEESDMRPTFKEWGYEAAFIALENDAADEVRERYVNSNDPDCSYWTPSAPKGDGWTLASIYDTEDGPVVCYIKPLKHALLPE